MSLFPLPTNPQSVKSNALVVGPNTSGGMYMVSNPVPGSTGTNDAFNYLISSGNNPIYFQIQPTYGGNLTAGLTLTGNALTSTVPILSPASPGEVIYNSGPLLTPSVTAAVNMATAGPGGTPLPVGTYLATAFVDLAALPGGVSIQNGTVATPIYWNGTVALGSFTPSLAAGSSTIFANPVKIFTSAVTGQNTVGSYVTGDFTDVYTAYPIPGIPWQWQLQTLN